MELKRNETMWKRNEGTKDECKNKETKNECCYYYLCYYYYNYNYYKYYYRHWHWYLLCLMYCYQSWTTKETYINKCIYDILYINMYCAKLLEKEINGKECETKCNEMRAKFEIIICLSLICLRQFFSYIN